MRYSEHGVGDRAKHSLYSRMSACAIKRWGTGTPCVKEATSGAAKEMADKLAKMRAEREKQDTMWTLPPEQEPLKSQEKPTDPRLK